MKGSGQCFTKTKNKSECSYRSSTYNRFTQSESIPSNKYSNSISSFKSLPTNLSSILSFKQLNINTYSIDKYIIQNNKKFPITLNVSFKKNVLDIVIPFPKGYKPTPLFNIINNFGRLIISIEDTNDLYVNLFYINSQVYSKVATKYEKDAFKGFGKILFCFAFNYIINVLSLDIEDKSIKLSAEGGITCDNTIGLYPYSYEKIKNYYKTFHTDDPDLLYYIDKYEYHINNQEIDKAKDFLRILRKSFCAIHNEKKLIKYYASYGFKILSKIDNSVLDVNDKNIDENMFIRIYHTDNIVVGIRMFTSVKNIMKKCNIHN